jgi:hypothetical protein
MTILKYNQSSIYSLGTAQAEKNRSLKSDFSIFFFLCSVIIYLITSLLFPFLFFLTEKV